MKKLVVAFHSFANAPKNGSKILFPIVSRHTTSVASYKVTAWIDMVGVFEDQYRLSLKVHVPHIDSSCIAKQNEWRVYFSVMHFMKVPLHKIHTCPMLCIEQLLNQTVVHGCKCSSFVTLSAKETRPLAVPFKPVVILAISPVWY
jgi:hypothetical protein